VARSTKLPPGTAWAPPPREIVDIAAVQALARGDASEHQQRHALTWIIESVCRTYQPSYSPAGDRDTAFAEGRRFVGLMLVETLKLNLARLQQVRRDAA
jgi:hypothetical protein